MEEYVYGFPLVMMDVTKGVLTAASKTGELKAPINHFALSGELLRAQLD